MSYLIKQLETIGQNAEKRNTALDSAMTEQLERLNKKDMKALMFTPGEGISKED